MRDYEAERHSYNRNAAILAGAPEEPEEPNMHPDMDDLWNWAHEHHVEECMAIIADYFKTCPAEEMEGAVLLFSPTVGSSDKLWGIRDQGMLLDARLAFEKFRDKKLADGYVLKAWRSKQHEEYNAAMAEYEADLQDYRDEIGSN